MNMLVIFRDCAGFDVYRFNVLGLDFTDDFADVVLRYFQHGDKGAVASRTVRTKRADCVLQCHDQHGDDTERGATYS